MKRFLLILCTCIPILGIAQVSEHVITHNEQTIVCNSSGTNSYISWGVFPQQNVPVRRIVMNLTLGHPEDIDISHWDYSDHIKIRRIGGVNGEDRNLEIGRMLTPYGSTFSKDWSFTWDVDVTDFSMLLRDSVEIEYIHSGYEKTNVGWALTIDFKIDYGQPHIIPLAVAKMWQNNFPYGNTDKPITESLLPVKYETVEGSRLHRLRIQHTGHGMDRPNNCSEFCSRWRKIWFDQQEIQHKELWKKCGDNPLYPQGGTWVYDRAMWCPGDLQQPDVIDINPEVADSHVVAVEMEPYTATKIQAKEAIAASLIQYSEPVNNHDMRIEKIITPNNDPLYNRSNPKCFGAQIEIRNLGKQTLRSLNITYYTKGYKKNTFKWKGELPYYASTRILLPGLIQGIQETNEFFVTCSKPNGKKDAWQADNSLSSAYEAVKPLPEQVIINYKTNYNPEENNLFIINASGDTIYSKSGNELKPDSYYNDTLSLISGKYEMTLEDKAGDGLFFWARPQQGFGFLRILDVNGRLIHMFGKDFGNSQMLAFETKADFEADTINSNYDFAVFPRDVKRTFRLDYFSEKEEDLSLVLYKDGKPIENHHYAKVRNGYVDINISHLKTGKYNIAVFMDGKRRYTKLINKVDK